MTDLEVGPSQLDGPPLVRPSELQGIIEQQRRQATTQFLIAHISPDERGLVAQVSRQLTEYGANIDAATQVVCGGLCVIVVAASVGDAGDQLRFVGDVARGRFPIDAGSQAILLPFEPDSSEFRVVSPVPFRIQWAASTALPAADGWLLTLEVLAEFGATINDAFLSSNDEGCVVTGEISPPEDLVTHDLVAALESLRSQLDVVDVEFGDCFVDLEGDAWRLCDHYLIGVSDARAGLPSIALIALRDSGLVPQVMRVATLRGRVVAVMGFETPLDSDRLVNAQAAMQAQRRAQFSSISVSRAESSRYPKGPSESRLSLDIVAEEAPGVLCRIAEELYRRGFNIEKLSSRVEGLAHQTCNTSLVASRPTGVTKSQLEDLEMAVSLIGSVNHVALMGFPSEPRSTEKVSEPPSVRVIGARLLGDRLVRVAVEWPPSTEESEEFSGSGLRVQVWTRDGELCGERHIVPTIEMADTVEVELNSAPGSWVPAELVVTLTGGGRPVWSGVVSTD